MNAQTKLTGKALAQAYGEKHPLAGDNPGKVSACYYVGGWIVLQGENLKPHPDMAKMYPNGWSLFYRIRSGKARDELGNDFAEYRKNKSS